MCVNVPILSIYDHSLENHPIIRTFEAGSYNLHFHGVPGTNDYVPNTVVSLPILHSKS